jgi:hypothetical protein
MPSVAYNRPKPEELENYKANDFQGLLVEPWSDIQPCSRHSSPPCPPGVPRKEGSRMTFIVQLHTFTGRSDWQPEI